MQQLSEGKARLQILQAEVDTAREKLAQQEREMETRWSDGMAQLQQRRGIVQKAPTQSARDLLTLHLIAGTDGRSAGGRAR
jgi:hypothetical protein